MTPTIAALAAHVDQLTTSLRITWMKSRAICLAIVARREIWAPAIDSEEAYCGWMHEAGHCETPSAVIGRGKDFRFTDQFGFETRINTALEAEAWTWARRHSLCWTDRMQNELRRALLTYKKYAAHGADDWIWRELDEIAGQSTVGHLLFRERRRQWQDAHELTQRVEREVQRERERQRNTPIARLERQLQELMER